MASTTVEIARPPDKVFAFVTDPTKLSAWQDAEEVQQLGGWCQTPLPRPVRMTLQNRASESPSPPLRVTSATDLIPENADFGRADRDIAKNTSLLAPFSA